MESTIGSVLAKISERCHRWRSAVLIAGLLTVAVTSWLLLREFDRATLERTGYLGIFVLSFLTNASMFLPVLPTMALVVAGAWWLDPLPVAVTAAAGSALGELVGYALGSTGRKTLPKSETVTRLKRWLRHYGTGTVTLFLVAAIPNPAVDVAGILAGAAGYPWWAFALVVAAGRVVRYGLLAAGVSIWFK